MWHWKKKIKRYTRLFILPTAVGLLYIDLLFIFSPTTFFCVFVQFKATIKDWEDKHKELNDQIKVYQKAQKELEDSVVLKDHNVEVRNNLG